MTSPNTPHTMVNPPELGPATGFAHAVLPTRGRPVYLAGQIGSGPDGAVAAEGLLAQFDLALANILTALAGAGGTPEHMVRLSVYTTDVPGYRESVREIGRVYRSHLGRHYPAMALFGVTELFDPAAVVELVGDAVVPEPDMDGRP